MAKNSRKVKAYIENLSSYTSEELLTSETLRDLVIKEVPNAIEEAIKNKSQYATLFEVNNSNHYIDLHKKDWASALSACLSVNITIENYPECSRINSILTRLQQSNKQSKTITKTKIDG